MIFLQPKNVRGAMFPSIYFCWMFGIGIIEYPVGHPRPLLSLCWSITHLLIYSSSSGFAKVPEFDIVKNSAVANHNYHLSSVCCTIFVLASMIIMRKTKILQRCNEQITLINENLNKFAIPEDYEITFRNQIMQLVVSFTQMIMVSLVCYFIPENNESYTELPNIIFWVTAHYQVIIIFVVGCTYCGYMRYIGNRFHRLNTCFLRSVSDGGDSEPFLQDSDKQISTISPITFEIYGDLRLAKAASRQWTVHVLRETRSIHYNLCAVAKELNRAFGIPLIFFMAISFCTITSLLFSIYLSYDVPSSTHTSFQPEKMIPGFCWLIPYVTAVYYVIYCCSVASYEAQKTGEVIHEMVKSDITNDIQSEINVFLLQLMQNPLKFTAKGFFTLDYTLIRGIAGSVTTYLVIMVQMRGIYDRPPEFTSVATLVANSTN